MFNIFKRNHVKAVEIKRRNKGIFKFIYTLYSGKAFVELIDINERKSLVKLLASIDKPYKYGDIKIDKDIAKNILDILGSEFPHFVDAVIPVTIYEDNDLKISISENTCIFEKKIRNSENIEYVEKFEFDGATELEAVLAVLVNNCYCANGSIEPLVIKSDKINSKVSETVGNVEDIVSYDTEEEIIFISDRKTKMIKMINRTNYIMNIGNSKKKDDEEDTIVFHLLANQVSKILQNLKIYNDEIRKEMNK